jgi:hypothetical protein
MELQVLFRSYHQFGHHRDNFLECTPSRSVLTSRVFDLSTYLTLVRSTSFILLQGVPSTISLDEVRSSILAVPGVTSLHELHVWQLSESKIVASVHVLAERRLDFMHIASSIRKVLHHLGIHSSTIQPEYIQTSDRDLKVGCSPIFLNLSSNRSY